MDPGLLALKNAISLADNHEDDFENDEELLAELLELQGADNHHNRKPIPSLSDSKRKIPVAQVKPTARYQDEKFRMPIPEIPKSLLDEGDEDLSDVDIDDDALLSELNGIMDTEESDGTYKKYKKSITDNTDDDENTADKEMIEPGIESNLQTSLVPANKLESSNVSPPQPPPIPQRTSQAQPPPIPQRTTSIPLSPDEKLETLPPASVSSPEDFSLKDKANSLLLRRRKLYLDIAKEAKAANDRTTAVNAFETVKLFNQALDAIKEGAELSAEDLEQIPPSPKPYVQADKQQLEQPESSSQAQLTEKPIEKRQDDIQIDPSSASKQQPFISEDLRLVLMRQMQLKNAALTCKQKGDLQAAKEYLILAHRMDQMVEGAKCGLPIDIKQIPNLPSTSKAISPSVTKKASIDEQCRRKCQTLEKELLKQIDLCRTKSNEFQLANNSKNILIYEALEQKSKKDLQCVQMAMMGYCELPSFKIVEISLPNLEVNPAIPDDQLHLRISKIENLRLPEGWRPSDCYLFVFYKFPYPHGAQQVGKTPIIKGTTSPEFPDLFILNITRKTKRFTRICKTMPLKLEIYNKGGFLRSDKLFGHADISLADLEQKALINGRFDILDGRKKTGGYIHVEIQISKPLGDGINGSTFGACIKRKWIKLDD